MDSNLDKGKLEAGKSKIPPMVGALAAGLASAAALLGGGMLPGFGILFALLAPLPLFLCGLVLGVKPMALAAFVGSAAVLVTDPPGSLSYVLFMALPPLVMAFLALQFKTDEAGIIYWSPPGRIVLALLTYGLILFVGFFALVGADTEVLNSQLQKLGMELEAQMRASVTADQLAANAKTLPQMIEMFVRIMPGLISLFWLLLIAGLGLLAQTIAQRLKLNLRSAFHFVDLSMPSWLPVTVGVAGIASYLAPDPITKMILLSASIILCFPFFFIGLGVIHALAERMGRGGVWLLVPFYVFLLIVSWPVALVLIALGMLDPALKLQERWRTSDAKANRIV